MDLPSQTPASRSRIAAWLADELRPDQLLRTLVAACLGFVLELIVVISFAALLYSGPLASKVGEGIGMIVLGDAALVLVVALLSSYPGSVAVGQDAPSAILAPAIAAAAAGALAASHTAEQRFATAVVIIAGSSLITGLAFMLLGYFRLGGLARFLPYPVIGGFLAGTGWLLLSGGLAVMSGASFGQAWLVPAQLARWLPGALLGALLLLASRRSRNPLSLPGILLGALALFYLGAWLSSTSLADLSARGWLLGPFAFGTSWQFPLMPDRLAQADWLAAAGQAGSLVPIIVVSVVALLLNASGIELLVRRDLNLNRELIVAGAANLLSGLLGGVVGYHSISMSNLNTTTSGGRRAPSILIALALAGTVLLGVQLLAYIPRMLLGGLLVFLGLGLLYEWLYGAWRKFSRIEFAVIVAIVAVIATRGFLEGIGVGLAATIGLFVIRYSRVDVVKHALSGVSYQSRVTRSYDQQLLLAAHGEQIFILQLQGFIFFGTANRLFERLRARAAQAGTAPLSFILLDFKQVSGIDSTALLSFSKIVQLARDCGAVLALTGLSAEVRREIERGELAAPGELRMFADLDYGVEWCENKLIAQAQPSPEQPISLHEHLAHIVPDPVPLASLMRHLRRREVTTGEYIIRQGEQADFVFFVESGQVTARLEPSDGAPVRLETMRGGRTVGELAFYLNSRRSAAVVADEPSTLYLLSREELNQIEQSDPAAASMFHRVVAHLLAERTAHLIRAVDALRRS